MNPHTLRPMRKLALLICLIPVLFAQEEAPKEFPASWEGSWKGPCVVVRAGQADLEFPMELHVEPLE